jgi:hypothetical protein
VTLKDTNGNVLDRKTEMFRLGICSGEITNLSATPEFFDIGDEIDISMAFNNTGTVDITGTAVIRVQDEVGELVQEFGHEFTDLAPSDSVSFDDTWDTSGAEEGTYTIIGYALYDAKATDPATTAVSTSDPPNRPSSPSPANHATGVSIDADLSWSGGDPDAGDTVTYDVYFGTSVTPPFKETIGPYPATQSSTTYDPGTLVEGTTYYWQIVATDNHGITREGPVWEFTVEIEEIQLSLRAGWNMVSVPLTLADNSTDAVFASVAGVFTWNATATSREYYEPTVIEPEKGYWVAVTEDTTITVNGTPVDTWTTDIKAGWNMIGSVNMTMSIADPNDNPDGSVIPPAYWWDPESKSYVVTTDVEPGKGYWTASVDDCMLTFGRGIVPW